MRKEGCGNMYDLEFTLTDGDKTLDAAKAISVCAKLNCAEIIRSGKELKRRFVQ